MVALILLVSENNVVFLEILVCTCQKTGAHLNHTFTRLTEISEKLSQLDLTSAIFPLLQSD